LHGHPCRICSFIACVAWLRPTTEHSGCITLIPTDRGLALFGQIWICSRGLFLSVGGAFSRRRARSADAVSVSCINARISVQTSWGPAVTSIKHSSRPSQICVRKNSGVRTSRLGTDLRGRLAADEWTSGQSHQLYLVIPLQRCHAHIGAGIPPEIIPEMA